MKSEIVRVWGAADEIQLEYQKNSRGTWEAVVPPDLSDGTYAAEIWAENEWGAMAHWTGFLFMHNGRACMHLEPRRYMLWLQPEGYKLNERMSLTINYEGSCIHCLI